MSAHATFLEVSAFTEYLWGLQSHASQGKPPDNSIYDNKKLWVVASRHLHHALMYPQGVCIWERLLILGIESFKMDSVHSDRLSCSFSLEDVASNSKGGTRRRSQQLENSGLPKTCETCGSLASQLRRSSVCSTSKLDDQEGKKSVRSPRHRCELTSSSKYSAPRPRRIWDELPGWQLEYEALTPIQKQVMEYVASVGENASAAAKDRLKRTWRGFNISEQDFSMIEVYLAKKVPLTIRIDIQGLVPYLMNDPFYR